MSKPRLTIIVPYRDRADQLGLLVAGLAAYFDRDKVDCDVPYRVLIVEQETGLPFNRGAMKNVGYILARDISDYVCFHDVDFLPIWADYSYADRPMPIAWHGAVVKPVNPARPSFTFIATDEAQELFAPVLLCPLGYFAAVNGYANSYWGWGMEDTDLRMRFEAAGIQWARRKGTFQALPHASEGHHLDGSLNAVAKANQNIFARRWRLDPLPAGDPLRIPIAGRIGIANPDDLLRPAPGAAVADPETTADGLTSCRFHVLRRESIANSAPPARGAVFERVTVALEMRPSAEQRAAAKSMGLR